MPDATIAASYVALAERIAVRLGLPRVRALHLPPPSDAQAKDAEFCAVELDNGAIGFSYVCLDAVAPLLRERINVGTLAGTDALDLARGFASTVPAAKALGFAAINALAPPRGEHVGMIGLFHPLLARIADAGAWWTPRASAKRSVVARSGARLPRST